MSPLERRLRKAEAAFPAPELVITREERHVAKLRLFLAVYQSDRMPKIKQRSRQVVEKLGNEILSTVKKHNEEQFKRHLADWVQPLWKLRWGRDEFLPPVCGNEYDDWEVPNLYERRVAIRHVPLIAALIGAPDVAFGPPKYTIKWDHIFETLREEAEERLWLLESSGAG